MNPGSVEQRLLTSEAFNKAGINPYLGGTHPGVPIRRYNPATGDYDIVGQNPNLGHGEIFTGQSIANVPGAIPSAVARESAIDWAKVPPAMFQKGFQAQPGGGVTSVPGYPQAEGAVAGARAGATLPAEMYQKGVQMQPGGGVAPVLGMPETQGALKAAEAWAGVAPDIARATNTPRTLGPGESLVVPGQLGGSSAQAQGGPTPLTSSAAGGVVGVGRRAPGVIREGINPLYAKGVEGSLAADQERISKDLQANADKANDTMATAQLIGDLIPRVATGWSAEAKLDAARVMKGLGISDDTVKSLLKTDASSGDVLQKMFLAQTAQAVRVMGAREPGSVISLFGKAYPRLETQANATKLMENVLTMQGQRAQDEFALAQGHHEQAVNALRSGQNYAPLSEFTAQFNSGPHSSLNYLKGAQAMSNDPAAWKGVKPDQIDQIVALLPHGKPFLAPDGTMRVKP